MFAQNIVNFVSNLAFGISLFFSILNYKLVFRQMKGIALMFLKPFQATFRWMHPQWRSWGGLARVVGIISICWILHMIEVYVSLFLTDYYHLKVQVRGMDDLAGYLQSVGISFTQMFSDMLVVVVKEEFPRLLAFSGLVLLAQKNKNLALKLRIPAILATTVYFTALHFLDTKEFDIRTYVEMALHFSSGVLYWYAMEEEGLPMGVVVHWVFNISLYLTTLGSQALAKMWGL